MRRGVLLLLVVTACPRESAVVVVADAAVAPPAAVVVEVVDAGPPPPPETADVSLTFNERTRPLKWAIAKNGYYGVAVILFSHPASCGDDDDNVGATISFEVPAGPGRSFYAGHPIGVNVIAKASDQQMKFPIDMGPMGAALGGLPTTLMMGPASVSVTVEPIEWKKGARIRGRIEGSEAILIGTMAASGTFDAELCSEPSEQNGLPAAAPKTPVKAKTVHAIVRRRAASQDEAVDQSIKRSKGSYPEISQLVFHDKAKVPCPRGEKDPPGFMFLQSIGGTDQANPQTMQQPASAIWREGDDEFGATSDAWVQFEKLAFGNGEKVRGSLWTQREGVEPFAGRFEATVCAP